MTDKEDSKDNKSTETNVQTKNPAEQFEYWKHFESAGGSDKDRMVTIVTTLLAFDAAVLGYMLRKPITCPELISFNLNTIVPGIIGALTSILGIYVVLMLSNFANQNWKVAEELEERIPDIHNVLKDIPKRHRVSHGMASVFKVFLVMSIGMLILFCVIIPSMYLYCRLNG